MNTGVDFGVFTVLTLWNFPILAAQTLSYSAGVVNSYLMNRSWTFKQSHYATGQLIRFLVLNLLTLSFTYGLLIEFHNLWNWPILFSKFVATGISLVANFMGSRLWVFALERD
jgi:putative flippase GtrA